MQLQPNLILLHTISAALYDSMKTDKLYSLSTTYLSTAYLLTAYLSLSACSSNPDHSVALELSEGSTIILEKPFDIPPLYSHVLFQHGAIIKPGDLQPYDISCILDNRDLGPKVIQVTRFIVTDIQLYEEMYSDAGAVIRYYTEFYLRSNSQQADFILTCQTLDDTTQYYSFPTNVIRQATGNYLSFIH